MKKFIILLICETLFFIVLSEIIGNVYINFILLVLMFLVSLGFMIEKNINSKSYLSKVVEFFNK